MENTFLVYRFVKTDNGFIQDGFDEYKITYLIGKKPTNLRIVVNGVISKQIIPMLNPKAGYRERILLAISDYKNDRVNKSNLVTKPLKINYLFNLYNKKIVNNFLSYLNDGSTKNRDEITKYELI